MSQPTGDPSATTSTATTATPNSMPGAAPGAPQTAENKPPAPSPMDKKPDPPAATTPPAQAQPADPSAATETNVDWKERARLWEERAKTKGVTEDALKKAEQWDAYQESQRTEEEKRQARDAEKDRRIATLEQENLRGRVSKDTGVPENLIAGTDEASMRESAKAALEWKGPGQPPAPTTSAAPATMVTADGKVQGPTQIKSRDELRNMTPSQVMQAYRDGRMRELGADPPAKDKAGVVIRT